MHDKKVKVIYFSLRDTSSKEFELSWRQFFSFLSVTAIVLLFVVSVTLALITDFYQNLEMSSLSKTNKHLRAQLSELGHKLSLIQSRVGALEVEDDHLRIVADLPKIDDDTRNVGVGGTITKTDYEFAGNKQLSTQVNHYQDVLEELERRLALSKHSRTQIKEKLENNQFLLKHTPSIRPVDGGRISDMFGMRMHPIIDKLRRHPGIDISAERGTEVFATASGTVEKVMTDYKKNRGYGQYVLIDHGNGVKTLYGHLSKILTSRGKKINRGDAIGLVGDTGLATGPHLHYEVRKNGKQTDPLEYIWN